MNKPLESIPEMPMTSEKQMHLYESVTRSVFRETEILMSRPMVFVLGSTDHGSLIFNRMDYAEEQQGGERGFVGCGASLLFRSQYAVEEIALICNISKLRREIYGDGVMVIDGGANIGIYTVQIARTMTGWGSILAFEPYKWSYRALCGNVCIANAFNAEPIQAALGKMNGVMHIKRIDPRIPMNFGGVSLKDTSGPLEETQVVTIDSFSLKRLDVLKLDVEGMEIEALEGAAETIKRCKPVIFAEHHITGLDKIEPVLRRLDYTVESVGVDILAIHESDPVREHIRWHDSQKEKAA